MPRVRRAHMRMICHASARRARGRLAHERSWARANANQASITNSLRKNEWFLRSTISARARSCPLPPPSKQTKNRHKGACRHPARHGKLRVAQTMRALSPLSICWLGDTPRSRQACGNAMQRDATQCNSLPGSSPSLHCHRCLATTRPFPCHHTQSQWWRLDVSHAQLY